MRFYAGGVIPTTPTSYDNGSDGGLKLWHIAVMVIGSLVVVTAVIVIVTCIIKRKKKN